MKNKIKQFTDKQACLFGHMLGDILGAGFEFKTPQKITEGLIHKPRFMSKTYHTYPKYIGLYTDDFSQTLCVETCLNDLSLDFDQEMLLWQEGKYWATNHLFDIGMQTSSALSHFELSGEHDVSGLSSSGNGALMRIAPLAFVDGDVKANVLKYSNITHNNQTCIDSGVFYIHLLKNVLKHRGGNYTFDRVWDMTTKCGLIPPDSYESNLGSGYVVDTLNTIKHVIARSNSFHDAIVKTIQLGNDTDTNAAIVGSVAALWFGLDSVTYEWLYYIEPSLRNEYTKKLFELE